MGTAWHQVVPRAFRRGSGQDGRLNIHETVAIQEVANIAGHPGAETQAVQHFRATQVYKAILQANIFAHIHMLIQRERRRCSGIQDGQLLAQQFDLPSRHVSVFGTGGTTAHTAGHLNYEFTADLLRQIEALRGIRIEHDLGNTVPIAKIQKDDPTVIAATMNPTAKSNFLIDVRFVDSTAIMTAHTGSRCI